MADFLRTLRSANELRDSEWPWREAPGLLFRALEFAGEAGEVADAVKKLERARLLRQDEALRGLRQDLADEIADALITLDNLAMNLGFDLQLLVQKKFNEVSRKRGFRTHLNFGRVCSIEPAPPEAEKEEGEAQ